MWPCKAPQKLSQDKTYIYMKTLNLGHKCKSILIDPKQLRKKRKHKFCLFLIGLPALNLDHHFKWMNKSSSSAFGTWTVMLLLMLTVAAAVVRVSVIPSAAFHIYYVRGCCKGAATGLCECIKYKADPLGDRHTVSVPLCLDCCK